MLAVMRNWDSPDASRLFGFFPALQVHRGDSLECKLVINRPSRSSCALRKRSPTLMCCPGKKRTIGCCSWMHAFRLSACCRVDPTSWKVVQPHRSDFANHAGEHRGPGDAQIREKREVSALLLINTVRHKSVFLPYQRRTRGTWTDLLCACYEPCSADWLGLLCRQHAKQAVQHFTASVNLSHDVQPPSAKSEQNFRTRVRQGVG